MSRPDDPGIRELERSALAVVRRVRASLPADLRARAEAVALELAPFPGDDLVEEGVEEDSLGLFSGPALNEPEDEYAWELRITLFLWNIWDYADGDWAAFRDEVRTTYLHELGHYLGLDEDGVAALDLA